MFQQVFLRTGKLVEYGPRFPTSSNHDRIIELYFNIIMYFILRSWWNKYKYSDEEMLY